MTIVSRVFIEPGQEPVWDAAWRERLRSVRDQPGWISAQLCIPTEAVNERIIIGTWETRADWEAWHASEGFQATRQQMETIDSEIQDEWWHEVIVSEHRAPSS